MTYSISYDKQPIRFLKQQDKHIRERIVNKIENTLKENPVPHNARSIVGQHNCFRIRIGDYRVLYRVDFSKRNIVVFKIDKRPRSYD